MSEKVKIILFTTLITVLCIFGAKSAMSADVSIRGGAAIVDGSVSGGSKVFGLRYAEDLFGGLRHAGEVGGYVDNLGNGRKGAVFAKYQLGISPGAIVGVYGFAFTGPGFVSKVDSQLGSPIQFFTDFGFGIRDHETFLGIAYSHISNAGIKLPNKGRDFIVMEMGFYL